MKFTTDELRTVTILEGLPEWQLAWFSDHGEKIDLTPKLGCSSEANPPISCSLSSKVRSNDTRRSEGSG